MNDFHLNQLYKVLTHIDNNLNSDLSLSTIATVGNYSVFHFHRLFKAYTGETLNEYITRKRLENIAAILIRDKTISITQLAYLNGFSSNASLTKTFKKMYNINPSQFKKKSSSQYDKIIKSKNGQTFEKFDQYLWRINNLINWLHMNATVNVMDLTPIKLVFVSHIGIDGLDDAFSRIFEWASLKELTNGDNVEFVRIYNDSFKITSPNKVRMEIGIPVHQKVTPDSGIQFKEFEPRRCIVGNFEINLKNIEKAWSSLFIWMNENGYKPGKQRPFEIIKNNFNKHPQKKCIVDLYIPVE